MKKLLYTLFSVLILALFASCYGNEDEDSDDDYGEHDIAEIYGYTYEGTVNASSGNKLSPEITLYNATRLDWNMSSNGMENNQFYYAAEPFTKDGKTYSNVYETYWYTDENLMAADTNRTQASMKVFLAINTLKNITVEVENAGTTGAGSSMAGTPIDMNRNSDTQNTTPSEITKKTDEDKKLSETDGYIGTFYGETKAASTYFSSGFDGTNEEVVISANSDGTVKVVHTNTAFPSTWTFDSVTVTESSGAYTFSGSGTVSMAMPGSTSTTASSYNATFFGTFGTDEKLGATFTAPTVMGGTTVTFTSN